ncbi:MAG: hypothetical protein IJI07_08580 [Flexilinea sp.]|nr:hypothetical protein [Flexilinea sp.]
MKKIIFALLCICLMASAAAAFAEGETEGYTVKYYHNNCLAEVPEDETVYQYGDEVEVLFEPVEYMNGLIFYGWDWDDDGIADFGYSWRYFDMPKKDVKLKAICIAPYSEPAKPVCPCPGCCAPAPHPHPRPKPEPNPFQPGGPDHQGPSDTGTSSTPSMYPIGPAPSHPGPGGAPVPPFH